VSVLCVASFPQRLEDFSLGSGDDALISMAVVGKYVRGLYGAGDVQGKFGVSYVKINIYLPQCSTRRKSRLKSTIN